MRKRLHQRHELIDAMLWLQLYRLQQRVEVLQLLRYLVLMSAWIALRGASQLPQTPRRHF